jgi:multisubunit Na+/H+ antiporter MnhB subunit
MDIITWGGMGILSIVLIYLGYVAKGFKIPCFLISAIIQISLGMITTVTKYDTYVTKQFNSTNQTFVYLYNTIGTPHNIEPLNYILVLSGVFFLMMAISETFKTMKNKYYDNYE